MGLSSVIRNKLKDGLSASHVSVVDESKLHANHLSTKHTGGGHYRVAVVSDSFKGKTNVERHRMVHQVLEGELKGAIHALSIKAFTREEWKTKNPDFKKPSG